MERVHLAHVLIALTAIGLFVVVAFVHYNARDEVYRRRRARERARRMEKRLHGFRQSQDSGADDGPGRA